MTLKRYATNMRYTSSSFPSENSNVLCLGVFAAASISIMEVAGHTRQSMNSVLSISSPQQRHQSPLLTGSSYFMCQAKITPVKTQTQYQILREVLLLLLLLYHLMVCIAIVNSYFFICSLLAFSILLHFSCQTRLKGNKSWSLCNDLFSLF